MYRYHPENDAYERLGVSPNAEARAIQEAFEERMAELQEDTRRLIEAREILLDERTRTEHDRGRTAYREALEKRQLAGKQKGGIALGALVVVALLALGIALAVR